MVREFSVLVSKREAMGEMLVRLVGRVEECLGPSGFHASPPGSLVRGSQAHLYRAGGGRDGGAKKGGG